MTETTFEVVIVDAGDQLPKSRRPSRFQGGGVKANQMSEQIAAIRYYQAAN